MYVKVDWAVDDDPAATPEENQIDRMRILQLHAVESIPDNFDWEAGESVDHDVYDQAKLYLEDRHGISVNSLQIVAWDLDSQPTPTPS